MLDENIRTRPPTERIDPRTKRLRALLDDSVSLERAYAELNRRDHAAASMVEALMYSLRERGPGALQEPATLQRLHACSTAQLHEVAERVQNLARAWMPNDVVALIAAWSAVR
jgi:hypothetical protein